MTLLLQASLPGLPMGQGSMRSLTRPNGTVATLHSNPEAIEHRTYLAMELAKLWRAAGWEHPAHVPVQVVATYLFPRPAVHWLPANSRRAVAELRPEAPTRPATRGTPDLDKLCRLVGDALELAGVLANDCLIAEWHASREWLAGGGPGLTGGGAPMGGGGLTDLAVLSLDGG